MKMNRGTSTFTRRGRLLAGAAIQAGLLLGTLGISSVVLTAPVAAQDFTNVTASGRVTGANGSEVGGARVTVRSDEQGFERVVTTSSDGSYRVSALPQGRYTFTIEAEGYQTYTEAGVLLNQASSGNSFTLASASGGTAAEEGGIVVTGTRTRVSDFDRTTVGAVVDVAEVAARVPVARDLTSIVLLAPGVTKGDTAFGNLPTLSGASVSENTYFLNGLNITDFRKGLGSVEVPFVFYQTVEVKNGGVPAEFGRFTGGFINAVSKSGSNELHAGLLVTWSPDATRSDVPNTLIDYNHADEFDRLETVVTLSGPIWKDHLFFAAFYQNNYERLNAIQTSVNPNTVVDGVAVGPYSTGFRGVRQETRKPYYGGKIDFLPFDGHRLEFTYFDSSQEDNINYTGVVDAAGGGYDSRTDSAAFFGAPTSSVNYQYGGENYIGRYTGQLTSFLTVSGAYGKSKNRDNTISSNPNYPFISDTSGQFSPALTGNATNVQDNNSDTREFYRADVEVFVNLLGQHHFKGGYDRENLTSVAISNYTGNRAITYVYSGASGDTYVPTPNVLYTAQRTFINGGTFKSQNEAFYLQDSWSLLDNRLTLNLGIRNDKFTNDNVVGDTYYDSGSAWAPRLAFTFDPLGDGQTKLYGSFGRYFLPVPSNTNIRLAGAELDYTRYFTVAGVNPDNTPIDGAPILTVPNAQPCPDTGIANCELISDGAPTPTEATVSKSLKPQSVDEFVAGVEQRIGDRIKVGFYGIYRKLNNSLEDVAIDKAVNDYCVANAISGCDSIWTGFHQYVLVNPGSQSKITLSDPINGESALRTVDFSAADLGYPAANRTYKALTATFEREFDGKWGINASYTWSRLRGNIEGGIRSDNGQSDSGITTAFDQPGLTNGAYGFLPGHAQHQIKVFGSYQIFDWLNFGAQFQAISPRKFGCIGRVPRNVDAFAGAYGAAGFYCNLDSSGAVITDPAFAGFQNNAAGTSLALTPRGSRLESDWNIFLNLSAQARLPIADGAATFRVDVFNVFNRQGVLDLRELGTQGSGRPRGDYGSPLGYQAPRSLRFSLGFEF